MRAPIALDHDETTNQWTIHLDDGAWGTRSAALPGNIVDRLAQRVATQRAITAATRSGVQAQVTVVEYANLGDSATFIRKPLEFDPDETVGHLLGRAHGLGTPYRQHHDGDRLELQVIRDSIEPPASSDPWQGLET